MHVYMKDLSKVVSKQLLSNIMTEEEAAQFKEPLIIFKPDENIELEKPYVLHCL